MRRNGNAAVALPVFAALGDETRLRVVSRLSEEGPLSIARLTEGSHVSRQAVTKHLRVLEDAGLVRGERAGLSAREQKALFLNQEGEPFSADGKSLDRIVRLIGQKAGVRVWTHMLRHTYATHTLASLQRSRDRIRIEPLAFLQRQLGHASINTTMVYLHLVNELADDAVLAPNDAARTDGGFKDREIRFHRHRLWPAAEAAPPDFTSRDIHAALRLARNSFMRPSAFWMFGVEFA